MPYPGPYTQLAVGMTGVVGVVLLFIPEQGAGIVRAYGDFPALDVEPNYNDPLLVGKFEFSQPGAAFSQGQEVSFDIVQGAYSAYAANLQPCSSA